jgi:phospholipid transport system substrate-binding protein
MKKFGEPMKTCIPLQGLVFFLFTAALFDPAWAGTPTEQLSRTTDKILGIVTDPALKEESKTEEKKRLIRKAVDERFDWEELSRRALGRHWAGRSAEERAEFVDLFGQLLERTYLDRVKDYSGEQVSFVGETVDGDYAAVDSRVLTAQKTEVPVFYRMRQKGDEWMVYDIVIEGVSLVGNYRSQFQSILARRPYEELVRILKERVAEKRP